VKEGSFPDLEKQLTFYENSFDRLKAKESGVIIPNRGVNSKYDASEEEVNCVLADLDNYLVQQKKRLRCKVKGSS
jgi:DNA mismatch repair protein MSH6